MPENEDEITAEEWEEINACLKRKTQDGPGESSDNDNYYV